MKKSPRKTYVVKAAKTPDEQIYGKTGREYDSLKAEWLDATAKVHDKIKTIKQFYDEDGIDILGVAWHEAVVGIKTTPDIADVLNAQPEIGTVKQKRIFRLGDNNP